MIVPVAALDQPHVPETAGWQDPDESPQPPAKTPGTKAAKTTNKDKAALPTSPASEVPKAVEGAVDSLSQPPISAPAR